MNTSNDSNRDNSFKKKAEESTVDSQNIRKPPIKQNPPMTTPPLKTQKEKSQTYTVNAIQANNSTIHHLNPILQFLGSSSSNSPNSIPSDPSALLTSSSVTVRRSGCSSSGSGILTHFYDPTVEFEHEPGKDVEGRQEVYKNSDVEKIRGGFHGTIAGSCEKKAHHWVLNISRIFSRVAPYATVHACGAKVRRMAPLCK